MFFTSLLEAGVLSLGSRPVTSANSHPDVTLARSEPVVVVCFSARTTGDRKNQKHRVKLLNKIVLLEALL